MLNLHFMLCVEVGSSIYKTRGKIFPPFPRGNRIRIFSQLANKFIVLILITNRCSQLIRVNMFSIQISPAAFLLEVRYRGKWRCWGGEFSWVHKVLQNRLEPDQVSKHLRTDLYHKIWGINLGAMIKERRFCDMIENKWNCISLRKSHS